jgi:hypothetical protein
VFDTVTVCWGESISLFIVDFLTNMPETGNFDDDEYVARLLAEDARKSSIRYASMGMSALLPKRCVQPTQ